MGPLIIICTAIISIFAPLSSNAQLYTLQREITVAGILNEPFLLQNPDPNARGNDRFDGFCKDIAEKLFEKLGLLYIFSVDEDRRQKYGTYDNATGHWSGIIGDLISKTNDMAIADLSVTAERAEFIDFSVPFMETRLAILLSNTKSHETAKNGDISDNLFSWFHPMSSWFWVTFFAVVIFLLFLIFFTEKIVSQKIGKIQPPPPEGLFAEFSTRVFGTPKSIATRLLQVTLWIFLLICFSAYTSNFSADKILNLIHHHTVVKKSVQVTSAEELLSQDKIKYGILGSGSTFSYFQKSDSELIVNLRDRIIENGAFVQSYTQGIIRVRNSQGAFAFIMESPAAKYAITRKPCDLSIAPEFFGPKKSFSIAIPKDSRKLNLKKINAALLELNEEGVLDSLSEKWFKDQTECVEDGKGEIEVGRKYHPLTLESMASLFILLTITIFVVFIIAGVETGLNRTSEQIS